MKVTVAKYYTPSGRCIQAIDYSKKDMNGESLPFSDSLRHPFKTRVGRIVYDGAGIEPDINIEPRYLSNIASVLVGKLFTFDYTDKYNKEHSSISGGSQFRINDNDFKDFINFLSDKDYSYVTRSERALEDFKKLAEREKYFDAVKTEYDALTKKMSRDKKEDLIKFKAEICEVLESEIVSRYYYQKGRIESSLGYDKELDKANQTLLTLAKYQNLLKPGALIKTSAISRPAVPDQNMTSILPDKGIDGKAPPLPVSIVAPAGSSK
jgi:carboxyl-terminal processing protease